MSTLDSYFIDNRKMISKTKVAPKGSSHENENVMGVDRGETMSQSSQSSVSLVPKWKDDDDLIDIERCEMPRIPSTLEFFVPTEVPDVRQSRPHESPSRVSYSHHHESSRNLQIEMIEGGFLPPSLEKTHSNNLDTLVAHIATDTKHAKEKSTFRRRFSGSIDTNPLSSESQSSSPLLPSPATSRSILFHRSRLRISMIVGTFLLVMVSTHDNMQSSRQYYRQQDQLSVDLREEIAFPLGEGGDHSETAGRMMHMSQDEKNRHDNDENHKGDLPKFYFPQIDSSNADTIRGASSAGRPGSNLAMARSPPARPLFVPDTPLPDGGFKKPLERFVYDSETREQRLQDQRTNPHSDPSFVSWTSWIASIALISMLFDTGWKELQRYRRSTISFSRDE